MTKSTYDEDARRRMRLALRSTGISVKEAPIIVDLACHVADKAVADMFATCRTGPSPMAAFNAIQLAIELTSVRMRQINDNATDLARVTGAQFHQIEVQL